MGCGVPAALLRPCPSALPLRPCLNSPWNSSSSSPSSDSFGGDYRLPRSCVLPAVFQAEAGTERGGFVLTGVDVLLDDRLRGYVLETNCTANLGILFDNTPPVDVSFPVYARRGRT